MLTITRETLGAFISTHKVFQVKKSAITMIRFLTSADKDKCFISPQRKDETPVPGHIWTKEGLVEFKTKENVLCRGIEGEFWPMKISKVAELKEKTSIEDIEGWAEYINKNISSAVQMDQPFETERPSGDWTTGEAGDWLLFSDSSIWPVGAEIFANSYVII